MSLSRQASVALSNGDHHEARQLYLQAFELEQKAALTFFHELDNEPTRSVMFRSAASLALLCELWRPAEKLAAIGLSGNPPAEIADELRAIFEKTSMLRKLEMEQVLVV